MFIALLIFSEMLVVLTFSLSHLDTFICSDSDWQLISSPHRPHYHLRRNWQVYKMCGVVDVAFFGHAHLWVISRPFPLIRSRQHVERGFRMQLCRELRRNTKITGNFHTWSIGHYCLMSAYVSALWMMRSESRAHYNSRDCVVRLTERKTGTETARSIEWTLRDRVPVGIWRQSRNDIK